MNELHEISIDEAVRSPIPARARVLDARDQIAELNAARAARDHFLAFVGHELRNTMAPLHLLADQFTALADDPHALPAIASRATKLVRSMRRLIATVHWVADVGDLRRGMLRLQPTTVDLTETVREVCRELAGESAARGAELVFEPGAPVIGSWDRARLQQIVTSLVSNAIDHAGGRIDLGVIDRGGDAELVIRDHGPGLDPARLRRLFDPPDPGRHRTPGGVGVGLWVVKTLTSAMRGSVVADNCADGGARFCVVVPRVVE
jgi:signal transduction histidine kinase